MSIKKLFDARQTRKTGKILAPGENNSLSEDAESIEQVRVALDDKHEFVPPLDYSEPANFVKFGSAYRYYVDALEYVADEYPYDGTSKDKIEFANNLNPLEKYILDTEHPSSTGYAIMGATYGSRGSQSSTTGYYSASAEFIHIKGGPNASSKLKADGTPDFKDETANVFYTGSAYGRRSNNLEFGGASGSTIEFFFKKSTFSTATSTREVVYDAWTGLAKNQAGYGRFTVEVKSGSLGGDPDVVNSFFVTYQSGTAGVFRAAVPVTSSGASLADGNWHHYAFVLGTSGSSTSIDVYKDGECFGTQITTGSNIGLVTGAIEARVGALITAPSGTSVPAGYGKLSASLDEFRIWKDKRTPEEVGRNWFTNIYGGTNTTTDKLGQSLGDTDLGLYLKFNEGITGTDSTDSVVLDYSGRISNGTWTGFTSGSSRNTGSALVSSSASEFETADPIVRKNNPLYISKKTDLTNLGNSHDYQNNSSLYYSMPDWIINEDSETNEELYKLTQIMASYLDTLYAQTTHLFKVGDISYTSGSDKPFPYNDRLLQSMGFETPELFTNANLVSQFLQKDDKRQLELKLHNIKNEIYKNIYNNLSFIYKSKGTAKAFRNLVRCYGVGDDLFQINTYVNNETYKLDQDASSSLGWYLPGTSAKRYVDMTGLSNEGDISGSVFSFPDASNSNSYGFLSGNANLDSYAFTLEAEIYFPRKPESGENNYPSYPAVSASLFGFHTPSVTDPTSAVTTWAGSDYGLQVYAVHTTGTYSEVTEPIQASRDAFFVVKNSAGTTLLTSSTFTNVYDNKNWKFALSLRPTKYPYAEDTTGTTLAGSEKYTLELYAVNSIVGEKQASLSGTVAAIAAGNPGLTASLSYTDGSNILEAGKRVYVGAHRTNFTGSVVVPTDIRASGIRWWNTYLPSGTIDIHSYDVDSFGLIHPYRNVYNFESNDPEVFIPEIQTLAFNWDFITVTGSDGSGEFVVTDFSSGSAGTDYEGSYQGTVFSKQNLKHHTGKGIGFVASSTPVKKEYVYTGKQRLPEQIYPEDMVEVKNSDEETFTRDSRPYRFFFAVEKSMYDAISREMLEMFASIQDFNNLIGDPVNKYRMRYKDMEKLREIFFRRIGNTPDLDKYLDYFKWLDSSMGVMIEQLFPASAKVAENVRVMVENHVLERNKIKFQYPTLEDREPDVQAGLRGSGCSQLYNWRVNHAPVGLSQDTNCGWWFNRAERNGPTLSTGIPTALQTARQTLFGNTHILPTPAEYEDTHRNTGENIPTAATKFACFEAAYLGGVIGGVNQEINKIRNVSPFTFDEFRTAKDCDDEIAPNQKVKINFRSVKDSVGYPGDLMSPFSIYSSSVDTGYRTTIRSGGLSFHDISNMHEDSYHPTQYEVPMQGPFTKQHVGGLIYRNNKALLEQNPKLRSEGFTLAIASSTGTVGDITLSTTIPKGQYYRGLLAKSPVNITNILTTTASAGAQVSSSYVEAVTSVRVLGNFSKNYEVVHTQGRDINNLDLRLNTTSYNITGAASPYLGGLVDYEIPQRKATFKSNKTVFVERFSAPGGPATSTPAFLDVTSQQYAANNALPFRNIGVRAPLYELLKTRQAWGGFVDGIYPEAIDLGHTTLEELNTGSFSVPVVSYHKTQRNVLNRIKQTLAPAIVTGSIADNDFITRPIPQADRYHWFQSINKNDTNYKPYDNVSPARTTYGFYVDNESTYPKTFGRHGVYLPTTSSLTKSDGSRITDFDGPGANAAESDYRNTKITSPDTDAMMVTALNGDLVFRWSGGSVFPIWKALRTGETPLGREPRESNTYTRYETVSGEPNSLFSSSARSVSDFSASYRSAPVTSKHKPMYHLVNAYVGTAEKDSPDAFTDVSFRYTYGNEFQGFAHLGLDEHLNFRPDYGRRPYDVFRKVSLEYADGNKHAFRIAGIKAYKQFVYDEVIYPKDIYTYLSGTRERLSFSTGSWPYWRDNGAGTATNSTIASISTSGTILANTASYNPEIPRIEAGFTNSQGYVQLRIQQEPHHNSGGEPAGNGSGSIWPLDSFLYATYMPHLKSNSTMPFAQSLPGGELLSTLYGGLQWTGTNTPDYTGSLNARSAQYVYTVPTVSSSKPEGRSPGGPTTRPAWTAGSGRKIVSGPNKGNSNTARYPFFDSYSDWAEDVRVAGQDHTIVPEYRASEHVFKTLDTNSGRIGLFNNSLLSITGSSELSSSSQIGSYERPAQPDGPNTLFEQADPSFIERYSTTELFTYLESVMERDFEANGPPTDLRLTTKTVQKLLPYDGFYPVNRATQLATLFSQSISPAVTFTGGFTGKRRWQNVLKPYFAPGIFFNSIKSGIAVDHPVRSKNPNWSAGTDSWDDQFGATTIPLKGCLSGGITGSTNLPAESDKQDDTPNDSSNIYWYRRANFEHILDPVKYGYSNISPVYLNDDLNSHLRIDATGSFNIKEVNNVRYDEYKSGVGNFFGAVPDFFLKNGQMSKLVSKIPDPNNIPVEKGKTYVMEVVLRKTDNFNMYSNPYAFGVPTATGSQDWGVNDSRKPAGAAWPLHRGEFAPFTPPYFYGDSIARIVYKPQDSLLGSGGSSGGLQIGVYTVTLQEILADIESSTVTGSFITYHNSNDYLFDQDTTGANETAGRAPDYGWNRAWLNKMNVSASVVLTNEYESLTDESINLNQWVIMPKWECPILDFPREDTSTTSELYNFSSSIDIGSYNSGSSAPDKTYGMWHQYGTSPDPGEGVKLLVRGIPSEKSLRKSVALTASAGSAIAEETTLTFSDGESGTTSYTSLDTSRWAYVSGVKEYFITFTVKGASTDTTYALYLYTASSDPNPSISGSPTNIGVGIGSTHGITTSAAMITAIKDAIHAKTDVSAVVTTAPTSSSPIVSADGGVITITNSEAGAVPDAASTFPSTLTSGGSSIATSVTAAGAAAGTALTQTNTTILSDVAEEDLGNLAELLGFVSVEEEREEPVYNTAEGKVEQTLRRRYNQKEVTLGNLADSKKVYEAVAAIPYYLTGEEPNQQPNFINIPPNGGQEFGTEIQQLIRKMERYNLPPALQNNLDRLKTVGVNSLGRGTDFLPLACYLFEFSLEFDKQDLADIWQGIMPEQSIRMLGKQGEVTVYGIDHALVYGETGETFTNPERLDNRLKDLLDVQPDFATDENANCFKPEIQWLVFKVKQKGMGSYREMIKKEITPYLTGIYNNGSDQDTTSIEPPPKSANILQRGYNWPYDYFSLVELVKLEAEYEYINDDFTSDKGALRASETTKKIELKQRAKTVIAPEE